MGTLGALAGNKQAIVYATRRLRDGAKYAVIINELGDQFGIALDYHAFRGVMRRHDKDLLVRRSSDNQREVNIKNDARAGFSLREIAKRNGVSFKQAEYAVRLGDYITEKDDSLRRALQDRQRRPKWMDRAADESIDGPLTSAGKVFAELGDHECRYSIGRDADGTLRFCGEPRAMDGRLLRRPYCKKHGDLAVIPQKAQCEIEDWMLDGYAPNRRPS